MTKNEAITELEKLADELYSLENVPTALQMAIEAIEEPKLVFSSSKMGLLEQQVLEIEKITLLKLKDLKSLFLAGWKLTPPEPAESITELAEQSKNAPLVLADNTKIERVDGWISVHERLPEEGKPVIVWNKQAKCVDTAYLCGGVFVMVQCAGRKTRITHWQPLPAPPKGE